MQIAHPNMRFINADEARKKKTSFVLKNFINFVAVENLNLHLA
jgi:hypothetical protein